MGHFQLSHGTKAFVQVHFTTDEMCPRLPVQVQVFFSGTLSNFSVPEFKKLTWWEVRWKAAGKTVFHGTTEGLHYGDRQTKCFFVDRQSNM